MNKFYSCLPIFLLVGCAQVSSPSSGSKPAQQPDAQKEQQANAKSIDECMSLPYVPSDLAKNKTLSNQNADNSASKNNTISSSVFCEKYKQTKEQAFTFFQEYPQYMRSKEDEEQLMAEFKKVLLESGSKNLSIYQTLLAAHKRLQAL
ncbi:invasion lipoprotein InvH [Salmonella enterica subsp. houtenae]|uniref:Invasion lipoprotein InvH n=2 Tax=Salmonella houtenae TaxID=59205 RepID=A0A5Y6MCI9_SALHO|nr:invasion lipoprotein InvH [Salmonella enterica subsp. enterica]EAO9679996.1 invasion lipoprotein InvH [Salmonella enterica]EBF8287506.1 invasion lipoprotein InvH [Salmonella enterica subsp. houtenae]EBQ5981449.1 invasion lipoprotein InvH [Salmonella enterica subsp. houtenae serovar Houten]ECM3643402.1 invasion lipoprotein InvH [Salmonella enterica subsp. enterica serovar Typhimurium]EDS4969335.1 invasion lipoprotein InvH [Salmonella enterica subsp. enterica serovar O rough]EHA4051296.1 inv